MVYNKKVRILNVIQEEIYGKKILLPFHRR